MSLDKMGNQWLHLSVVNFIGFFSIVIFNGLNLFREIFNKSLISKLWIGFLLAGLLSVFFAENTPEALITFNQYFTFVFSFFIIQILISKIRNPIGFILNLVLFSLFLDLIFTFKPILDDLRNSGQIRPRSMDYKGLSANINIISFMMALKLPFAINMFFKTKKNSYKSFLLILIGLSTYSILVMGTRGAFIALLLVFIFTLIRSITNFGSNAFLKVKSLLILVLVFTLSIISNLVTTPNSEYNSIQRASTISINTNDGSVNQRLRYYKQGVNHFISNPLMGVGIGNWKLISIEYDKDNIDGFIVPFHAHNDFIQIAVELGIFGLLFYMGVFINLVYHLFKKVLKKDEVSLILLFSVGIFILDSMLNFPIARPISIITFLFLISLFEQNQMHNEK